MTHYRMIHVVAMCAAALVFLLGVMSCSPTPSAVGSGPNGSEYGENAMETVDYPPPSGNGHGPKLDTPASRPPTANGHDGPPPPPLTFDPERCCADDIPVAGSAHRTPNLAAPATDTVAEGPDPVDDATFKGLGAFVKPPVWKVGNSYSLEFVVGQTEASLKDVAEDRELMKARDILMAQMMRVTLDPHPDFEIKPQNPDQEIQELSPERTAAWFWNVKPLKPGKHTLVARVQALERGPDGELVKGPDGKLKGRFYPPRSVEIEVRVGKKAKALDAIGDASSFGDAFAGLFKSWEKMLIALTALIVAAAGLWAAVRKLRKPK
jgi:hypothetical protein